MLRKRIYVVLMIFCMLGISGCSKEDSFTEPLPGINGNFIGALRDDVHRVLGEPSGQLSGFSGDIYIFDNGTQMVFYYDDEMKIERIIINAKDGTNTLNIK